MAEPKQPIPASIDLERLDLLVDGELTEKQRRELLTRLDEQPDGWRRCALAFLEAQSWQAELGGIFDELSTDDAPSITTAGGSPPTGPGETPMALGTAGQAGSGSRRRGPRMNTVLAMAASFIVALTLSLIVQDRWEGADGAAPPIGTVASSEGPVVNGPSPASPEESHTPRRSPATPPGDRPWETVTLVSDGEQPQQLDIPAQLRDSFDRSWLQQLPAPMPPEVRESLERLGHRVRHHRELMPIQMGDGRRLIVPVDEIEVDPAAEPAM